MTDVKTTADAKATGPILVTGATGVVGGEVVSALRAAGVPVRALVRTDDQAKRIEAAGAVSGSDVGTGTGTGTGTGSGTGTGTGTGSGSGTSSGVKAVLGDLNKPASLSAAMAGARAVFLLPGYSDMPGVLDQARQAGVGHVVQLSGVSAASGHTDNAVTAYMVASEQAVTASGLSHTIVRPSAFMSNALRWADQLSAGDTVRAQFPDVATAALDPADLGAVIAAALLNPERYAGQVLLPTGPEALVPAQQIAILATALNRDLVCEPLTDEQTRAQMVADGTPEKYIDAFFDFYVAGAIDESPVRPVVEEVTGRPPRTFDDWATAHAAEFAPRRTPRP